MNRDRKHRKIITDYWPKPIATRSHDWSAMDDNYEGGDPIGFGATEAEAITDLLAREEMQS